MIIPHLDRSGWISIIILSKLSTIQPNVIIWVNYTIFSRNDEVIPEGFPLQNQLQAIWWGEVFWGRLKLQQNPRKQKTILYNYICGWCIYYCIYIYYFNICMNLHECFFFFNYLIIHIPQSPTIRGSHKISQLVSSFPSPEMQYFFWHHPQWLSLIMDCPFWTYCRTSWTIGSQQDSKHHLDVHCWEAFFDAALPSKKVNLNRQITSLANLLKDTCLSQTSTDQAYGIPVLANGRLVG